MAEKTKFRVRQNFKFGSKVYLRGQTISFTEGEIKNRHLNQYIKVRFLVPLDHVSTRDALKAKIQADKKAKKKKTKAKKSIKKNKVSER